MNDPKTARRGVFAGAVGMALAIVRHAAAAGDRELAWILACAAGPRCGRRRARWRCVPLTAVPQRTALSHAFGGLAAGLVGAAKYYLWLGEGDGASRPFRMVALILEVILGFLTFTGSLMAAGKLQE